MITAAVSKYSSPAAAESPRAIRTVEARLYSAAAAVPMAISESMFGARCHSAFSPVV